MNPDPTTANYLLYILAAYIITFLLIGVMFAKSYRKYRKTRAKMANQK